MAKGTLGLIEKVKIHSKGRVLKAEALVDTGASMTSIDKKLARQAKLGPIVRTFKTKAPITKTIDKRPVVRVTLEIKGKKFQIEANLKDRSHMKFPILIGRNLLYGNFVVDVGKTKRVRKQ